MAAATPCQLARSPERLPLLLPLAPLRSFNCLPTQRCLRACAWHKWKRNDGQGPEHQEKSQKYPVRRMCKGAPTARMNVVVDQDAQTVLAMHDRQEHQQPIVHAPTDC